METRGDGMIDWLMSLAIVCDPNPMWEQARQETLAECHTMKRIWHQPDDCEAADRQLEQAGYYCAPVIGEVRGRTGGTG